MEESTVVVSIVVVVVVKVGFVAVLEFVVVRRTSFSLLHVAPQLMA